MRGRRLCGPLTRTLFLSSAWRQLSIPLIPQLPPLPFLLLSCLFWVCTDLRPAPSTLLLLVLLACFPSLYIRHPPPLFFLCTQGCNNIVGILAQPLLPSIFMDCNCYLLERLMRPSHARCSVAEGRSGEACGGGRTAACRLSARVNTRVLFLLQTRSACALSPPRARAAAACAIQRGGHNALTLTPITKLVCARARAGWWDVWTGCRQCPAIGLLHACFFPSSIRQQLPATAADRPSRCRCSFARADTQQEGPLWRGHCRPDQLPRLVFGQDLLGERALCRDPWRKPRPVLSRLFSR